MTRSAPSPRRAAQRGVAAVEFALGAMLFFIFIFGVIELARALYMWSTMIEVTRRAARTAANTDFTSTVLLQAAASKAMFDELPGGLPLRGNIRADNLAIDYLNNNLDPVSPMPSCPAQNIARCNADPNSASCIRFVRVRLCVAGGGAACARVDYQPIVSANFFPGGPLQFPTFATVTPAGTLGYSPGAPGSCM
jgi:hypothetical protein